MVIQDKSPVGWWPNIHASHNRFWQVSNSGLTLGLTVKSILTLIFLERAFIINVGWIENRRGGKMYIRVFSTMCLVLWIISGPLTLPMKVFICFWINFVYWTQFFVAFHIFNTPVPNSDSLTFSFYASPFGGILISHRVWVGVLFVLSVANTAEVLLSKVTKPQYGASCVCTNLLLVKELEKLYKK